jgi:hypothetical protein
MMLAWHFLPEDKRLGYGDGRLVEVGATLECEGEPALCSNGMHGSARLIDALKYANGPIVCRVEIAGDVIEGEDKLCGLFPDEGAAEAEDGSVYCSYECAIAADQVLCVSPEEGE